MSSRRLKTFLCLFSLVAGEKFEEYEHAPYYFPENKNYHWKPIPPEGLRCPTFYEEFEPVGLDPATYWSPAPIDSNLSLIDGVSCYKSIYSVRCSVNFVGWKTITHQVRPSEATEEECREAHRETSSGNHRPTPQFPSPNCGWWAEHWAEETFIEISRHPVSFDPYSLEKIDPLFPGGKCTGEACSLIHSGGLWIQTSSHSRICDNWTKGVGHLGRFQGAMVFIPTAAEPKVLDGSCRLSYCSRNGLRLNNGEFLYLPNPPRPLTTIYPTCPSTVYIKVHSRDTDLLDTEKLILQEEDREECLTSVMLIQATKKASQYQISLLAQRHGGPGDAYRLWNGQIEHAHVSYLPLYKPLQSPDPAIIGFGRDGAAVRWTNWLKTDKVWVGPNGVTREPGKAVSIPRFQRLKSEYDITMASIQELREVSHPVIFVNSNQTDRISKESYDRGTDGDVWGSVTSWFNSLWGSFVWFWAVLLGGAAVLVCLVREILCRRSKEETRRRASPRRKRSGWEDIEMTEI